MSPQLSTDVCRRIDGYRPTKRHVLDALAPGDLERLRSAVRLVGPTKPDTASRLLSHGADHLAWVRTTSPDAADHFSVESVEASIAAARASRPNASPFVADLRRLARAASPRAGHRVPQVIAQPPRLSAYTSEEARALLGVAGGMETSEGRSLCCGIALGCGAGIIASAATRVRPSDIVQVGEVTLVWAATLSRYIPVGQPWARVLAEEAARDGDGPLTSMYTTGGHQRVARRLREATGRPDLASHRLRNTFIVDLLTRGIPADIAAAAAGILPSGLQPYLAQLPPRAAAPSEWLSGHANLRPPSSLVAAMASLPLERGHNGNQLGNPGPTVADIVERFLPENEEARTAWAGSLGAEIGHRVAVLTDDAERAQDLLAAASVLASWATTIIGLPLTTSALLRETTIERWAAAMRDQISDASIASLRSRLRALARNRTPGGRARGRAVALGYSDEDLARLISARHALTKSDQRIFDVHWCLGLGAGASGSEALSAAPSQVICAGEVVALRLGARVVPVDHRCLDRLEALRAAHADEATLSGLRRARSEDPRQRISDACGVSLDPARLRATWLMRRLTDGVPLDVLTTAAGASIAKLNELCAALPPRPPAEQLAWHANRLR